MSAVNLASQAPATDASASHSFPFAHPATESEAERLLASLACVPDPYCRFRRWLLRPAVVAPIALVLIVGTISVAPLIARRSRQITVSHILVALSAFLTVSGLGLAGYQWQASLEQEAIRKYEGDVSAENVVEESAAAREMMKELYPYGTSDDEYAKAHYVYVELDSLEYALERYKNGLASAYTTARAVMTFATRCRSGAFRMRARAQVAVASYSPLTIDVVHKILGRFDDPCAPYAAAAASLPDAVVDAS